MSAIGGGDWFGPGRFRLPEASGQRAAIAPVAAVSLTDELGAASEIVVADGDVKATVRAYADRPLAVFRLEARTDLTGLATGAFDQPSCAWPELTPGERATDGAPEGLRSLVFQHCEFGAAEHLGPETGRLLPASAPAAHRLAACPGDRARRPRAAAGRRSTSSTSQTIGLNGGTLRCRLARRPRRGAGRLRHRAGRVRRRRPA